MHSFLLCVWLFMHNLGFVNLPAYLYGLVIFIIILKFMQIWILCPAVIWRLYFANCVKMRAFQRSKQFLTCLGMTKKNAECTKFKMKLHCLNFQCGTPTFTNNWFVVNAYVTTGTCDSRNNISIEPLFLNYLILSL